MYQIAFVCKSYANNFGIRLLYLEEVSLYILRRSRRRRGGARAGNKTRIVRESDTQKGSTRYDCMCASVRSSDYRTFVYAMRIDVMSYINK